MDEPTLPDEESTQTDDLSDRYLEPGSHVAHYHITDVIGGGGMGVLYRAQDTSLGRTVALKCPWPEIAAKPTAVARFLREARTTARLSHPHIVAVHEVFEHEGLPWLAMEFVRGGDLRALLARKEFIPIRDVLRWGEQVARALETAHANGVLHRDIKPANILISDDGSALLTDFGLARHLPKREADSQDPTISRSLTRPDVAVGTPAYWSPEQSRNAAVDERSDVFSLGAVLYEMCTGRRLSSLDGFESSHGGSPSLESRSIRRINHSVPASVEAIVRRAAAPHREDRYPSATELAEDLKRSRQEHDAKRFLIGIHRNRPGFFAMTVALLLLLAGAVGWSLIRNRPTVDPHPPPELTSTALITWPSMEVGARISPDRRWVSFISNRDGGFRVWVKSLDSRMEQAVTPVKGTVSSHVWSADGREIASLIYRDSSPFIRIAPALGGPPRKSIALDPQHGWQLNRWVGTHLYAESSNLALYRIDTESDEALELLAPSESGYRGQYDVRPDERRVVYTAGEASLALWTSDLDGDRAVQVTSGEFYDNGGRWMGPQWDSIIYSSTRTGQPDLWRVYIGDGSTVRITFGAGVERLTDVALDGSLLAFEQSNQDVHLWTMHDGAGAPRQLSSGTLNDYWPTVAADAEVIAFQRTKPTLDNMASYLGGQILLGRQAADGALETELVADDGYLPQLSADAGWLAYAKIEGGGGADVTPELWIQELATGNGFSVTDSLSLSGVSDFPLGWARDTFAWSGSVLYYAERTPRASGVRRVRTDAPEQSETVIPAQPQTAVLGLALSADGLRLAYVLARPGSMELRCRELASGEERLLIGAGEDLLYAVGWLGGDRRLLILRNETTPESDTLEVLVGDLSRGVRTLGKIEGGWIGTASLVAGRQTLYITAGAEGMHNIFAFSVADGSLRQVTDNALPGVTFSKVRGWSGETLVYTRQQRNTDIWTIEFGGQRQK